MVEPSEFRYGDYPANALWLSRNGAVLIERQMRSGIMIVIEVPPQRTFEVLSAEDDEVVQALPSNGADEALGVRVLPGTLRCRQNLFYAKRVNPQPNRVAIHAIAISDQITTWCSVREYLHDLLRRQLRSRMRCDIEVQDFSSSMLQYKEDEQNSQTDGRYGEEVDRDHLAEMVVQERLPGLRMWPRQPAKQPGDGAL